jgi:thioredoxin-like negative regulator of GroEL
MTDSSAVSTNGALHLTAATFDETLANSPGAMLFKAGQPVDTLVGAVPKAKILERLQTLRD